MKKIIYKLARFKVYLGRTAGYVSIINFVMIANLSINQYYDVSIFWMMPITFIIILAVGIIDNKLKIHEYEATMIGDKMTQLNRIIKLLEKEK